MLALQGGATGTGHIEAVIVVIAILAAIFLARPGQDPAHGRLALFIILMASGAVAIIDIFLHVMR